MSNTEETDMQMAALGRTGLEVSRLGVGLVEIGSLTPEDTATAERVLAGALDGGINFFDTAECYGTSEELIGKTVGHRRDEFVLATKAGHVSTGSTGEKWTGKTVRESIETSLRKLQTDYVDLVQMHAYDISIPLPDDVIQAVMDARDAGKTRFVGYSGENEDAEWAVKSGMFDTLQSAFNLMDQKARYGLFDLCRSNGVGFIGKRPIGNAVWGKALMSDENPGLAGTNAERFRRAKLMQEEGPIPGAPEDHVALALGYALAHEDVHTAILGTRSPEHMLSNIEIANAPPLSPETVEELHRRHDRLGKDWPAID
jgi:aryl-alcohol dehydrogenase-like predicted oxidoreductase